MELTAEGLNLTLDEIEEVEDLLDLAAVDWQDAKQGRLLKAIVWVLRKRNDPKAKLADVGKLGINDLAAELAPFESGGTAAT